LKYFSNSALVRFLLLFACGWAATQILAYFETIVVIFTTAAIATFLLSYPVNWLQRWLPRNLAVVIIFCLSLILIVSLTITIGISVFAQGQQLARAFPDLANNMQPLLIRVQEFINQRNIPVNVDQFGVELRNQLLELTRLLLSTLQGLISNLVNLLFVAIVTFFMLLEGSRLWYLVTGFLPRDFCDRLTIALEKSLLAFFWGRLVLAIFFTITTFIVLLVLQVPFSLFLSVLAGIFDLIPGIGSTIGITLIALFILPQSWATALQTLVICTVIKQIEENILLPQILKNSINISPVIMFIALFIGARVAGLIGIFLAIPLAGVIMSLLEAEQSLAVDSEDGS